MIPKLDAATHALIIHLPMALSDKIFVGVSCVSALSWIVHSDSGGKVDWFNAQSH